METRVLVADGQEAAASERNDAAQTLGAKVAWALWRRIEVVAAHGYDAEAAGQANAGRVGDRRVHRGPGGPGRVEGTACEEDHDEEPSQPRRANQMRFPTLTACSPAILGTQHPLRGVGSTGGFPMPHIECRTLLGSLACCVALLSWAGAAPAQIPDKFVNLKVLPKKITKDDLVSTMRQFSIGLGVRCNYCHAQADSSKGMNFASDAKKEKTTARAMIKMVNEINTKLIPKAGMKSPAKVQCITCHRGVASPKTLTEVMKDAIRKDGVDAGLQKYNELRSKYY